MDTNVAPVTVKVAVSDLVPKLAVINDVPFKIPSATPEVLFTVATLGVPEVQLEDAVTSRVDVSL
ncbi:MAG: hypothetical protein ABI575_01290 [Oxalobacteraceae bacterium]